ncbi:hypothetical protein QYE76_045262 [Lolium multiflorum]|uniref:Uncharacterized protein n=1 Tax=Lolium multiflorum TaxID=4521 RepID=A0AAD8TK50_LOLMU|nr:hypothetical protein QYE76_045262 [Lolium multiflorum]
MACGGNEITAGGDQTHLGPLGHLPPPNLTTNPRQIAPNHTSSTTLLAPTSISDTITDVSPFIPLVLNLTAHNYYHCRHLFIVHLGRCGLRAHIDFSEPAAAHDPIWVKEDFAILQWIYTRISTELFSLLPKDAMATRDEPIGHYYQRLKVLADELRELGVPVTDQTLITTLLAGITDKFAHPRLVIRLLRPPPSFAEVRSMLKLEEGHESATATAPSPQMFYSNNTSSTPPAYAPPAPAPAPPPPRPNWQPQPAGVSTNYKGKNPIPEFQHRNASTASSSNTGGTFASPSTWRPAADPWTGLVQAWQVPWQTGAGAAAPQPQMPLAPPFQWLHQRPIDSPGVIGRPPPHAYTNHMYPHHLSNSLSLCIRLQCNIKPQHRQHHSTSSLHPLLHHTSSPQHLLHRTSSAKDLLPLLPPRQLLRNGTKLHSCKP